MSAPEPGEEGELPAPLGPSLAFCLYKYFPFGGLQRDCLRIALTCVARGARVRIYTMAWQGPRPDGLDVRVLAGTHRANWRNNALFVEQLQEDLRAEPAELLVGFNRMPGLDVYYAADACYAERMARRPIFHRWTRRARQLAAYEEAVFGADSGPLILLIAAAQRPVFQQCYGTARDRFVLLPPGIDRDRCASASASELRRAAREGLAVGAGDLLVLAVGSGFATKGLDRSLRALAALPEDLRTRIVFGVVGQDNPARYRALAHRLGLAERVRWLGGRDDVPALLQGADLLLHPARSENTGTILLEACVAGLPSIASGACGYAHYLTDSGAGMVMPEPFDQASFATLLRDYLEGAMPGQSTVDRREPWRSRGIAFGQEADIYDMPARAATAIIDQAAARSAGGGR